MKNLMEIARDRNLERMEGQVLSDNHKMLDLVTSLNFEIARHPEDPAIRQVSATLQSAD